MKPTMLLALSFIHLALITMFPSGTVVAQDTVLDIYGNPALIGAEYYIYVPRGQFRPHRFLVIGESVKDDRVYLYDDETNGIPVIISQVNGSTMAVDTALTIKFADVRNSSVTPFWKVALEPDSGGNYFVMIGGYNEGYEFKLAQNESGKSHHLYYLTYTTISPFCNATAVGIGLLDSYLVAKADQNFQFTFVPVEHTAGTTAPLLSS